MKSRSNDNPHVLLSQSNAAGRDGEYHYPEAEFVLVDGREVHLWVDGIHFTEDTGGAVREGQSFLVRDAGLGAVVSEIESVDSMENSARVRHVCHWNNGDLEFPDSVETWDRDEITGNFDRTMGDGSRSVFIRQV